METSSPNVSFRRDLFGPRLAVWIDLLGRLDMVQLTEGSDKLYWNLNANKKSAVETMYRAFVNTIVAVDNNHKIWKMKVSLKIKFFAWYLRRGVILTKE
jgi:hypothetical protein